MKKLFPLFGLILFVSCTTLKPPTSEKEWEKVNQVYLASVEDAAVPTDAKVYDQLISIKKSNPDLIWKNINGEDYLLVVSWKNNASYYKNDPITGFYNTSNYQIWVSTAPELLSKIKNPARKDLDFRLKQILGLPPKSEYKYIVEFWVKPDDLFRPCPDSEIDDTKCETCFRSNVDPAYVEWINQSRIDRYYPCEINNKYPWTELGYTYDWNPSNKTHVGISEFVIDVNSDIVVKEIYETRKYFDRHIIVNE